MKIIDLSHTILEEMTVYPGTEPPIIKKACTIETDGFRETSYCFYSHIGTHLDAPGHILEDGITLDLMPMDKFCGRGVVLDFAQSSCQTIGMKELEPYQGQITGRDFVLLHTGWERYWGDPEYFTGFPVLSPEGAIWLAEQGIKGIGIDAISFDPADSEPKEGLGLHIHRLLLSRGILLIENLTNLKELIDLEFNLCTFPLKFKDADGSPVRAVALIP